MVNLKVNSDIIENINLVIFDKDGTLMELYNYWSDMVKCRVELAQKRLGFDESKKKDIMYAMGVDLEKLRLRSGGPVGLKKREIVMQAMVDSLREIGFQNTYDLCVEVFKEVDRLSVNRFCDIIKPIHGMEYLINSLYERKCKIAVATTDKTERAKLAVNFLSIADKIDIVVGEDVVKNCKPFPDMINLILEELSIDRKNAIMVGDAITDVEMGINAGVKASIGVCSGLTAEEKLLEKTKYVIEDISMLKIVK